MKSSRKEEIKNYLLKGMTIKEIADILKISHHSVNAYVCMIKHEDAKK